MDFSYYRPASGVLEHLKNVDFIAVVGPTAVGKTTLMKAAAARESSLCIIRCNTSRAMRPGEQNGVDYFFRTKEEMLERIVNGEYVQVAPSLLGDIYATAPENYPLEGVGMLAVLADALASFRALPFKSFRQIFVVPPNREVWQARLANHGFTPDTLAKRLAEAKRSFQYALNDSSMQFVINDNLERATLDFIAIAEGGSVSPGLQADQARARSIIQEILTKL